MSTLKADTEEKRDHIIDILDGAYADPENDEAIMIDGIVYYDQLAEIVDYLRRREPVKAKCIKEDPMGWITLGAIYEIEFNTNGMNFLIKRRDNHETVLGMGTDVFDEHFEKEEEVCG